jgi:hypothetical protein
MFIGHGGMNHRVIGDSEPGWLVTDVTLNDSHISLSHRDFGPDRPSLTTTPVSTRLTADYLNNYYAAPMWGRIIRIVVLVLLAVIVVSVVSPWFDLHPTTLRTFKRAITQLGLAVPFFWPGSLSFSPILLTRLRPLQSHPGSDIVARDCARLC